ncbi:MAG: hypothetical protein ABUU24_04455, partial [Variovorax sp.]
HTNVLVTLYEQMRDTPVTPDLDDFWQRLGVTAVNARVRFNDDAALAEIRRAITRVPARTKGN